MCNAFYITGVILILFNLYNTIKLGKPLTDMYEYEQDMTADNITHEMVTEIIWLTFVWAEFAWLLWGSIGAPKYFLLYIITIVIISIIDGNNYNRTEKQCAIKTLIDAICEFIMMSGCFYNI